MPLITLDNCSLELPIYGTINRSLKGAVMSSATGGRIAAASRNVTVVQALKDVSLEIRAGDRVGLIGHNGAGKTSLLRLVFSIVTSVSAEILVMDEWLSVGDADFVVHAEERLMALVDQASILVLASHNPEVIEKLCNVIVHLEHGELVDVTRRAA